ncbi:uncharacterized protein LOC109792866 [Cajanus cajan]|uniref:uncharacterized protein LOC109792866 n=1 Tax=Cajanus cajan TaxID=3821 RepID=UPI00098DCF5B|nr:uncharacterized protein LOC109792866 [Cajanus cajan]
MEGLDERNRVLNEELEQLKEQMARMLEAMNKLQHNNSTSNVGDVSKDIQFPAKFKIPDFQKYTGASCPKGHLTMYCRKMAAYVSNEKLLIHYFQEILSDAALNWYMQLDGEKIQTWKQLADAFFRRYKYSIDLIPNRSDLQSLSKKGDESFKTYAQRWREMVEQVEPSLSDKEMVTMFINSLSGPYYEKMKGNTPTLFADIVTIGDRVEQGLKSGKIGKFPESQGYKKTFGGNEINVLTSSATPRTAKASPKAERELDKIPISYTELFPQLVKASMLVRTPPQRKQQPPYPLWYRPEETCDYHAGAACHSIENCNALKSRVQELINAGQLKFEANTTHIKE